MVMLPGNIGLLTKIGYTFAGWNTKPDGSGTDYAAGAILGMGKASITLYAKWINNTYGDYNFTLSGSNAIISGYLGSGGDITIPSAIYGYPVTGIGDYAFYSSYNLTSVIIPNSVKSAETTLYVYIFLSATLVFTRIILLSRMINEISIMNYLVKVIVPVLYITFLSVIIPFFIYYNVSEGFNRFFLTCVVSCFSTFTMVYFFGLKPNERRFINDKLNFLLKANRLRKPKLISTKSIN
jgi:uncharacterized repeat protein (TIGR02543 family)